MSTYFITCPCSGSRGFFVSWSRKVSNLSRFCVCAIPGQFDACNYKQDIIMWSEKLLHKKYTETFSTHLFSFSQRFYSAPLKQYTSSSALWQQTATGRAAHYFHLQCIVGVSRILHYTHAYRAGVGYKCWVHETQSSKPQRNRYAKLLTISEYNYVSYVIMSILYLKYWGLCTFVL
jgi:hypothetical protein